MRRYAIPSIAALTASLTGCTDAIVGEWTCVQLDDEAMPYDYSYSYTSADESYAYTYNVHYGLELTVFSDLTGHLTYSFDVFESYSGPKSEDPYEFDYSGGYVLRTTIQKEGIRSYFIDIDDGDGELSCKLTRNVLDCEDDDGVVVEFQRGD